MNVLTLPGQYQRID